MTHPETIKALYGTYRLARLDADGMDYFVATPGAFWRSFKAALFIAPFYGLMLALRYQSGEIGSPAWHYGAIEILAYIISWLAFPVLMLGVTVRLGLEANYLRFMIAYNWAAVPQNMLYLPIAMLSVTGIISPDAAGFFALLVLVLIVGYIWFITKTAFDIAAPKAAVIVAMDFALSILINAYAEGLH
ncbi:MAG: hypothetical protein ACTSV1_10660 [Alphaproteobacteria bacterium]